MGDIGPASGLIDTVVPLVESWNGRSWRRVQVPDCIAVGSYGNTGSPGGEPASAAAAELWNGRTWTESRVRAPASSAGSVDCLSATWCVAAGNVGNVPYYTGAYKAFGVSAFWNGRAWRLVRIA